MGRRRPRLQRALRPGQGAAARPLGIAEDARGLRPGAQQIRAEYEGGAVLLPAKLIVARAVALGAAVVIGHRDDKVAHVVPARLADGDAVVGQLPAAAIADDVLHANDELAPGQLRGLPGAEDGGDAA